jgi:hypothetical protein
MASTNLLPLFQHVIQLGLSVQIIWISGKPSTG